MTLEKTFEERLRNRKKHHKVRKKKMGTDTSRNKEELLKIIILQARCKKRSENKVNGPEASIVSETIKHFATREKSVRSKYNEIP